MAEQVTPRERSTSSRGAKMVGRDSLSCPVPPLKNRASRAASAMEQVVRPAKKTKILIVHDGALAGLALTRVVEEQRQLKICGQTDNSATARDFLARYQPQIVLLGLSISSNQGIGLIKEFRKLNASAAIILLSSQEDLVSIQRAFRAGARGYLTMYDSADDVLQAIQQVAAGHFYASTNLTDWLLTNLADGEIESVNSDLKTLTDRELQVFWLIARGLGPSRLANELHLSVKTIETHQSHIKEKLGLRSAAELSEKATRWMVGSARQTLRLRRKIASRNGNAAPRSLV